jgi:glyoxylase-like metal-dependent hydrolase (beta-lactamase superfamily II)
MRILPNIYLIGSGRNGVCISDDFDCTVWLLDGGDELAMIEVGCGRDVQAIIDEMQRDGLDPSKVTKILLTHTHADHAGGAAAFQKLTGAEVYVGRAGAKNLRSGDEDAIGLTIARRSSYYPKDYRVSACPVDFELSDGDTIAVGRYTLRVIETPGHSVDSICFHGYIEDRYVLWTGDVIQFGDFGQFKGMISLLYAPGCSLQAYGKSVRKLADLEVDALLPSHRLFCVRNGKRQVDLVVKAFQGMPLPKSVLLSY